MKLIWFLFVSFLSVNIGANEYTEKIQPIFNNRCIACHSCLNAPCQINLQSYEGFDRGGNHLNVYDGLRTDSVQPTRIWMDAQTTTDWRTKGFFPINTSVDPKTNIFFNALATEPTATRKYPSNIVAESQSCADKIATQSFLFLINSNKLKMPYALPTLEKNDLANLQEWIKKGAPGPKTKQFARKSFKEIEKWELFLNGKTEKEKLVSRYLYEHLFLAHFYFTEKPNQFFDLIRSRTKCEKQIDVIATRRPNDDPNVKDFYYCLRPFNATIVAKTHMPFELNEKKLQKLKTIFLSNNWYIKELPSYQSKIAANPFLAFEDIPVSARYQFLLDNAEFIVGTFIKGPVCNGSNAVNSIQEQFYVFFIDPKHDLMVTQKEYENESKKMNILPGFWGSDVKIQDTIKFNSALIKGHEENLQLKAKWIEKIYPNGFNIDHIWDGDDENSNALLTIFRHDDNAFVARGAKGDLPKTIFVLNYSILERLVYNLVVNFDVYGNIGHQTLTRLYMDILRMEAEDLFLTFLPKEDRAKNKEAWYRGLITEARMKYFNSVFKPNIPTEIEFDKKIDPKLEFVQKVLFKRFNKTVRGPFDLINWKKLTIPLKKEESLDTTSSSLSELASQNELDGASYPRYFPDLVFLIVKNDEKNFDVYSIIHNKEHENISWIIDEPLRLEPKEDTLTIEKGFYGFYPNQFIVVEKNKLSEMVGQIKEIKSSNQYNEFIKRYGINRRNEKFWQVYDQLNANYKEVSPIEFGYIDLTRYQMQ